MVLLEFVHSTSTIILGKTLSTTNFSSLNLITHKVTDVYFLYPKYLFHGAWKMSLLLFLILVVILAECRSEMFFLTFALQDIRAITCCNDVKSTNVHFKSGI